LPCSVSPQSRTQAPHRRQKRPKTRYIATPDAAIEKISAIYDAGNADDATRQAARPLSTALNTR
jgi:hypothetical protein